jgi:hypothetical protein
MSSTVLFTEEPRWGLLVRCSSVYPQASIAASNTSLGVQKFAPFGFKEFPLFVDPCVPVVEECGRSNPGEGIGGIRICFDGLSDRRFDEELTAFLLLETLGLELLTFFVTAATDPVSDDDDLALLPFVVAVCFEESSTTAVATASTSTASSSSTTIA